MGYKLRSMFLQMEKNLWPDAFLSTNPHPLFWLGTDNAQAPMELMRLMTTIKRIR